jgi:hypothetical protein
MNLLNPVFRVHATAQTITQPSAGFDALLYARSRPFTLIRQVDAPADDFRLRYMPERGEALEAIYGRCIESEGRSLCCRSHAVCHTITSS